MVWYGVVWYGMVWYGILYTVYVIYQNRYDTTTTDRFPGPIFVLIQIPDF